MRKDGKEGVVRFFGLLLLALLSGLLGAAVPARSLGLPVGPPLPVFVGQGGGMCLSADHRTLVFNQYSTEAAWAYDFGSGLLTKIADGGIDASMLAPRVSGDVVVYAARGPGYSTKDIWGYRLSTGERFRISVDTRPVDQYAPDISGDIVVWVDPRDGYATSPDIYAYDLTTRTQFPVVSNDGRQQDCPAVSGDYVVWYEYDTAASHWLIRGKNLATGEFFTVVTGLRRAFGQYLYALDIAGDVVVWTDDRNTATAPDIYAYDISEHREIPVCVAASGQVDPRVWGGTVVWTDWRDDDGGTVASTVRGYDLQTSSEFVIAGDNAGPATVGGSFVAWTTAGTPDIYGARIRYWDASILLAGGAPATASRSVTAAVAAERWQSRVTEMRFIADGGACTPWMAYASTATVELAGADGRNTIRAQFRDVNGELSPFVIDDILLDTTPPTTTDDWRGGWSADPVTVSLRATDLVTGVASTRYSVDGSPWTAGTSILVPAPADHSYDGLHTVSYRSIDQVGNEEPVKSCTVGIDTLPPVSQPVNLDNDWHSGSFLLTLAAADEGSGVAGICYAVDGGEERVGDTVSFEGGGAHVVTYHAIDEVGNVEPERSCTVYIDADPPATSCDAPPGWVGAPATVHFSATDAHSGVAYTEFQIDGEAWQRGSEATISTGGTHEIRYRSVDRVGNLEPVQTATLRIDTLPPVTEAYGYSGWHNSPVTVVFVARDAQSAVASTHYSLDGGPWQTGSRAVVPAPPDHSGDGWHSLRWYSVDVLGNTEAVRQASVLIDTRGPVTRAPREASVRRERTARLYYRVDDSRSPTANVRIVIKSSSGRTVKTLDLGEQATGELLSCTFRCNLREGKYRFVVRAVDLAGNHQSQAGANTLTVLPPPSDPYLRIKSTASSSLPGWTKTRTVRLYYGRMTGGGWRVHARNEGGAWGAWHDCSTYGSFLWTLPSGDGTKKVILEYVNGSQRRTYSATIRLDTKRPRVIYYTAGENAAGELVGTVIATDNMSRFRCSATCVDALGSWPSVDGEWVARGGTARWVLLEPPVLIPTWIEFRVRDRAGNVTKVYGEYTVG